MASRYLKESKTKRSQLSEDFDNIFILVLIGAVIYFLSTSQQQQQFQPTFYQFPQFPVR